MMETTDLYSLFTLFWKNLEAHCFLSFHCFLTDSPTKLSETSESSELPETSKTVKIAKRFLCSQTFCHLTTDPKL